MGPALFNASEHACRLLEEVARVTTAATALDGQLRNATNALHEVLLPFENYKTKTPVF